MAKVAHTSKKAQHIAYNVENHYMKNRMRRIIRHVINSPNDTTAKKALDKFEKSGITFRRKTPKGHGFPAQKKVKVIKYGYGYLPRTIKSQLS